MSKEAVLEYIRNHNEVTGEPPSMRSICDNVDGVYRNKFYGLFPEGVAQAYEEAGVDAPRGHAEVVERMKEVGEKKREKTQTWKESALNIQLTERQKLGLIAIQHLEGETPSEALDRMLELDGKFRKSGLKFDELLRVAAFLEDLSERKWDMPKVPGYIARIYNTGLVKYTPTQLKDLTDFMTKVTNAGIPTDSLPAFMQTLRTAGLYDLNPNEVKILIDLCKELLAQGKTPRSLVKEVEQAKRIFEWFTAYQEGRVTYADMIKAVGAL